MSAAFLTMRESKLREIEEKLGTREEPVVIWVESRCTNGPQDEGWIIHLFKITIAPDGITTCEVLIDKINSK